MNSTPYSRNGAIRRAGVGKRVAAAALLVVLVLAGRARAQEDPTVTAREAERMAAAQAVAATNPALAAIQIEAGLDKESSPALDFAAGNFRFMAHDLPAAEQAYARALDKRPGFRRARENLARVYLATTNPAAARTVLQPLLAVAPPDPTAFLLMAEACRQAGQWVSAETFARQALVLGAEPRDALSALIQSLWAQDRRPETKAALDELLQTDPYLADAWRWRAQLAVAAGDLATAAAALECARRLGLAAPELLLAAGDLYARLGLAAEAMACYEAVLAQDIEVAPETARKIEQLRRMAPQH